MVKSALCTSIGESRLGFELESAGWLAGCQLVGLGCEWRRWLANVDLRQKCCSAGPIRTFVGAAHTLIRLRNVDCEHAPVKSNSNSIRFDSLKFDQVRWWTFVVVVVVVVGWMFCRRLMALICLAGRHLRVLSVLARSRLQIAACSLVERESNCKSNSSALEQNANPTKNRRADRSSRFLVAFIFIARLLVFVALAATLLLPLLLVAIFSGASQLNPCITRHRLASQQSKRLACEPLERTQREFRIAH